MIRSNADTKVRYSIQCLGVTRSLRGASHTRKIARALVELAPPTLACRIAEIGDLPSCTEDLDPAPPAAWTRFRDEIRIADAALITTTEYNRSVPGGLKNAIDAGSRPDYPSARDGLPAAVVSVSPCKLGGFDANHHIRQSLVFLNMPVMQQPEAHIGEAASMFAANDRASSPESRAFIEDLINSFADWATLMRRRPRAIP